MDVRTCGPRRLPTRRSKQPTDAIVRITSTGLCGSDLHLYTVMAPFMTPGDVLGHEPMGIVEAVGSGVTNLSVGDRVVVPFNISCGQLLHVRGAGCSRSARRRRSTSTTRGAALFGYTKLYGQVPGGQAELLRVPHADYGPIVVPAGSAGRPLPVPLRCAADRVAGRAVRRACRRTAPSSCSGSDRSATWRAQSRSTSALHQ